jgi:PAS domain S-box-containing protein
LFGTIQDISYAKHMEQQVQQLSLVASKVGAAVIITDAQGITEWANESFTRITGYTLEEVRGKKPGQLLQGPKTNPATIERIREALQKGVPFQEEILNYSKDKKEYWLNLDITPIRNKKGEITNFIGIQQDITARKQQEEQMQLQLLFLQNTLGQMNKYFIMLDSATWRPVKCPQQTASFLNIDSNNDVAFPDILEHALSEQDKNNIKDQVQVITENTLRHNKARVRLTFNSLTAPNANIIFVLIEPI